jgi:hypothetical protein
MFTTVEAANYHLSGTTECSTHACYSVRGLISELVQVAAKGTLPTGLHRRQRLWAVSEAVPPCNEEIHL